MDALHHLGLTGYEGAIYTSLLKLGKANAKEISSASNVPPTAVYPNLKALVKKGLVQEFKGAISLYEPLSPSVSIKSLVERKKDELEDIKEELIPFLSDLHEEREPEQKDVVSLSYGIQASHEITFQFFEKAKKTLYVCGWRYRSGSHIYRILNTLVELVERKVDVRLLIPELIGKNRSVLQSYEKKGIPIRIYPLRNFSVIICDGTECKITLKNVAMKERLNIHIKDADLSYFQQEYFLRIWKKAEGSEECF
ncbi:hypothetical protein CMO92_04920 [Candidatus Woesearchaeota archaeon]|nr:hypothetical protein [Candidatus Woesearchaeota archaeon]|tara:strand:+ start:2142 stop:2900 length:759 start_codon:yes stop_codon:yes gene_type:complete